MKISGHLRKGLNIAERLWISVNITEIVWENLWNITENVWELL